MVSFTTYAASFVALLGAVNAGFYTTYPVGADAVNPGQAITIKWRPDDQKPNLENVKKYTLKFMTGGNIVQTTVATIGDFDITKTSIPFTIPQTAPGMYFLMYTADNGAGSSWSTRFSVGGGTTWYPEGVATGTDPDATVTINPPTHHTSDESKPSSDESTKPTSSSEDKPTSSPDTSANTENSTTSPAPDTTTGSDDNKDSTAATTNASDNTSTDNDSTQASDSSEESSSSSEKHSSPSEEESSSSEETTTTDSGAAAIGLSFVAVLAANIFAAAF